MFSVFRLILGSLTILAVISCDVTFRDGHITRKVVERFICPNYLEPDACKNATDEVFEIVSRIRLILQELWMRFVLILQELWMTFVLILQELWMTFVLILQELWMTFVLILQELWMRFGPILQELWMRFVRVLEAGTSRGTVQKFNHDAAKKGAVDFTQGMVEIKGDERKAERIIKSLQFASYDESNLCDIKEGIPLSEYDVTIDEIADLTNMPKNLKKTIKRAKNLNGDAFSVNRLNFKDADGNLVFGRVAVIRRGKVLDLAYSLHSVKYELMPKQRQPDQANNLLRFFGSVNEDDSENGKAAYKGFSLEQREDFLAYFQKQAIKGFIKHCDYILKTITHGDDVVRVFGQNGDAPGEDTNDR